MDTIIERNSESSAVALILGILAIVVIGAASLYFLRMYPFNTVDQQPNTQIDVHLPTPPAAPSSDAK